MTIEARPVVKNKYWIVEQDGEKIGTIQAAEDGVVLVQGELRSKYPSIRVLGTTHNIRFNRTRQSQSSEIESVYDYPCRTRPFNAVYDLRLRLPLYTTSNKSKSYYCAGFYLVKIGNDWLEEYCPKKIILTRNRYLGPYKTKEEVLAARRNLSQETS